MAETPTKSVIGNLYVGPEGIKIVFEGIDSDTAALIASAKEYIAEPIQSQTYDTEIVTIRSKQVLKFVDAPSAPVTPPSP